MGRTKKLKIGFFTDSYLPRVDGMSVVTELFRQELTRLGHEVYVICPVYPSQKAKEEGLIIRLPSLPSPWYEGYRDTWPFKAKYTARIRRLNLDIIHTLTQSQIGIFGLYMARTDNIPLVTTWHADLDLITEYKRLAPAMFLLRVAVGIADKEKRKFIKMLRLARPKKSLAAWGKKLSEDFIRRYSESCSLLIAPSARMKKQLLNIGVTSRIEILPTGADVESVGKMVDVAAIRARYGLSLKDTLVIFVGRLVAEKNPALAVKAFSLLSSKFPKAYLLIVGDGPQRDMLVKQVAQANLQKRIIFAGKIDHEQVDSYLKAADIFVHSSRYESQGLVINEAAAAGKPIVMIGQEINDIVEDGVNGFLAENNEHDYAKKLAKLLADPKLRESFSAHSLVLAQELSGPKQAARLVELYQELLSSR